MIGDGPVKAGMQGKAVIDVGSNSIKLYVAENTPEGPLKTLADRVEIGALGRGLRRTGTLSRDAMERNCGIICRFAREARDMGCGEIAAVGTMALRQAENSQDFLTLVRESCGLDIRVLTGREEARLAYLGASRDFPFAGSRLVFDIGGGSTEFIGGRGDEARSIVSLPLGILGVTEEFLTSDPVLPREVRAAEEHIKTCLEEGAVPLEGEQLLGIGGTVTSMAAVQHRLASYNPRVVHGSSLTGEEVKGQVALFSSKTLAERRQVPGLDPGRAPVILAGALVVLGVMKALSAPLVYVSDRGLRHGIMEKLKGN